MEKPCNKCKKIKPLSEFNRTAKHKDGRAYSCRDCVKAFRATTSKDAIAEYQRRYRDKNLDRLKQYSLEYARQRRQETKATATNNGRPWSEQEDAAVMRNDISITEISKSLGRTYGSCAVRRAKLTDMADRRKIIDSVQNRIAREGAA